MSAFLQRLVQRANGTAESIRPRSPALFESATGEIQAPAAMNTVPPTHGAGEPPAPSLHPDASHSGAPPAVPGADRTASAPGLPAAPPSGPRITAVAALTEAPERPDSPLPARNTQASGLEQPPAAATTPARRHARDPAPATPRADDGISVTATGHRQRTSRHANDALPARAEPPVPRPAVSLPPPAPGAGPARRGESPRLTANPLAHGEAQNVVQVTIEHFEVRAGDAPVARPRARTRPRRDDSLADYARRRQEPKR